MSKKKRIAATESGVLMGWSYVRLNGKRPIEKNWAARKKEDGSQAREWAERGNVGIRTGKHSGGLVVVDIDKGADISTLDLPDTVTVITGNGGMHLYYQHTGKLGNSAGKIAEHIDVRGDGGQVVAVGSVHDKTGKVYRYAHDLGPGDIEIAQLPAWIVKRLAKPKKKAPAKKKKKKRSSKVSRYAAAAMAYELESVEQADEGERNQTLNSAAFSIGTLVGAGAIDRAEAESELQSAAEACGLVDDDGASSVRATIRSGLDAGTAKPREIEEDEEEETDAEEGTVGDSPEEDCPPPPGDGGDDPPGPASVSRERAPIMIPGTHTTAFGHQEVGNDDFADDVLRNLPEGVIYRRGGIPVEIIGEPGHAKLQILGSDRMRLIMDEHLRLIHSTRKSKRLMQLYRNTTRNLASLVLAAAGDSSWVRDMKLLTNYPVYTPSWELALPGWHDGVYYDEPPELHGVTPGGNWGVLDDILVDFPFQDDADQQNFISLLLTPMIRPAVLGNVPMFLIKSSLPRTGKTKLAEQVTGGIYLGEETPAMQWSSNEDERDKRILSILKQGDTILHVDNVAAYMDSPALASLVTSKFYQGRVLGQSQMMRLENSLTVVATANNPRATGEIVKRVVPITLQPEDDAPELRDNFKHRHLFEHILKRRPKVWSVMMGLVEEWKQAGRPSTKMKMGGFEGWISAMSGIMHLANADKWMSNWRAWVRETDPEGEDLKVFCSLWWADAGNAALTAKDLFRIAEDNDLFEIALARGYGNHGRLTIFSQSILGKYKDAPVDEFIIRRRSDRTYFLDKWR